MPTEPTPRPPLEPALQDAEQLLRESLTEVCHTDPTAADTGEMIRLDEMLAIAGEAAKRAVSLRRRMRQEGRATPRSAKPPRRRAGGPEGTPGATEGTIAGIAPTPSPEGTAAARRAARNAAPTSASPADIARADAAPTGNAHDADATPATRTTPSASSPAVDGSALASSGSEHRTFRDAHGVTWSVWAVHPQESTRSAGLRGTFVQGWLAFVCEDEKRRLSPVPDNWLACDDAELEQMCARAEVAKAEALTRRMPPIRAEEGEGDRA